MNRVKNKLFNTYKKNFWNILSILIGIIGILLAIYFGYKGYRFKSPYYAIMNENLISDFLGTIKSLDIIYQEKKIQSLTVSKFAFWNAGNETIIGNDIAQADPIEVYLKEGYEILGEPTILYPQKSANQFSIQLSQDKNYFRLNFDYIDSNEGVVIKFFHTGKTDEDLIIKGTIKGFGMIKNYSKEPNIFPAEIPYLFKNKSLRFYLFSFFLWTSTNLIIFYVNRKTKPINRYYSIAFFNLGCLFPLVYAYYLYLKLPNLFNFFIKETIK